MTRLDDIRQFLSGTDWQDAPIRPLAGDASARKYFRIESSAGPAVIMDAPPQLGNDIQPFIDIDMVLRDQGLNAPQLFKVDQSQGLILMEDFGDQLFFDLINTDPSREMDLYHAALDALDTLHKNPVPKNVTPYGPKEMSDAAALAPIWYAPGADPQPFIDQTYHALAALDWTSPVLVLRDFHAQNLVWCPRQSGVMQVGLLDFQDAQSGHHLYDAVSMIFDARRDVAPDVATNLLDRLRAASGDADVFDGSVATLSAQRNLRILGVFARLCARDGKPDYIDLIPRVWRNLQNDLAHPSLGALKSLVTELPDPTPHHLQRLRDLCQTAQQM